MECSTAYVGCVSLTHTPPLCCYNYVVIVGPVRGGALRSDVTVGL